MQKRQDPEKEKENELIRDRIKQAIVSKGIKLKQFARDSGMAYPSLRDYYSGLRKPGFDAIALLLRYTGVSAEWLLLGRGNMFPDEETLMANVDEALLGHIAQVLGRVEMEHAQPEDADKVEDAEEGDYLYASNKKEMREHLQKIGTTAVITGSVYNRVANITEDKRRDESIEREVSVLLRVNRSLSAMGDNEADEDNPES